MTRAPMALGTFTPGTTVQDTAARQPTACTAVIGPAIRPIGEAYPGVHIFLASLKLWGLGVTGPAVLAKRRGGRTHLLPRSN